MSLTLSKEDAEKESRIRVLLVDDNEVILQAAADFLQRQSGLDIVGAVCGYEQAIAQTQNLNPQVILIGLDEIGLEAITHLREVIPNVGIIAMVLADSKAYWQAVVDAGADHVVSKMKLSANLLYPIRQVTK